MIKRRFQSPHMYVLAFVIGTLIFISGFLITNQIVYNRDAKVLETNINNFYSLFESGIEANLLNEDVCSINFSKKASESFYFHRRVIADLEAALGKTDERVILQKRIYTLAQAQHLAITLSQKNKCNNNTIILFFYSNEDKTIDESERVGSILDSIAYQNKDVAIYSFDSSIGSDIVAKLMHIYNVTAVPAVVINEQLFNSPRTIEDIKEKYLGSLPLILN